MTEQVVLYTNPMSRGRIVRWMLEEIGQPYQTELVAYGPAMKAADYTAINPLGKVPAIRHGKTVVTETPAILAYLADAFPEAGLAPDLGNRGNYYRWLFFTAGPVEAAVIGQACGFAVPEERRGMVGYGSIDTMMDVVASAIAAGPYIAGENFSAADLYLASHLSFSLRVNSVPARPVFTDYIARMTDRDAYRRASEIDAEAQAAATA
ncbi:glutathione S-transferase family protein [Agrobacterium vitis]